MISCKYTGAEPWIHLNTIVNSLNLIRDFMGSQWSSCRIGDIESNFLFLVISLAAEYPHVLKKHKRAQKMKKKQKTYLIVVSLAVSLAVLLIMLMSQERLLTAGTDKVLQSKTSKIGCKIVNYKELLLQVTPWVKKMGCPPPPKKKKKKQQPINKRINRYM